METLKQELSSSPQKYKIKQDLSDWCQLPDLRGAATIILAVGSRFYSAAFFTSFSRRHPDCTLGPQADPTGTQAGTMKISDPFSWLPVTALKGFPESGAPFPFHPLLENFSHDLYSALVIFLIGWLVFGFSFGFGFRGHIRQC